MSHHLWLSSESMTVTIRVDHGIVAVTPPVVATFKGQPVQNLILWMKRQRGFQMQKRP